MSPAPRQSLKSHGKSAEYSSDTKALKLGGISALAAGGRGRKKRRLIGRRGREELEGEAGGRRHGGGKECTQEGEEDKIEKRRDVELQQLPWAVKRAS